jgi:cobyrinic acid a,c-diamide synthase
MVLGDTLIDGSGRAHRMAGLLPLATSFAQRRRHLGYRRARLLTDMPFGTAGSYLRGHEFHYASIISFANDTPLFAVTDATGTDLGPCGSRRGAIAGSFLHLIDRES